MFLFYKLNLKTTEFRFNSEIIVATPYLEISVHTPFVAIGVPGDPIVLGVLVYAPAYDEYGVI